VLACDSLPTRGPNRQPRPLATAETQQRIFSTLLTLKLRIFEVGFADDHEPKNHLTKNRIEQKLLVEHQLNLRANFQKFSQQKNSVPGQKKYELQNQNEKSDQLIGWNCFEIAGAKTNSA
jgi:hypothetical protein